MIQKRRFFGLVLFVVSATFLAAQYPNRPINHIIPATAGGGWDRSSRIVSDAWGEILGQPFRFSYVPGASGMIGLRQLAQSGQTGYQTAIITLNMVNMAERYQEGASVGWDDLEFIGNIITDQDAVFVHKDSRFRTIQELVDYGRQAVDPITVGTAHPTAVSTLAALLFIERTGINASIVSFNGGSAARQALAGQHVDMIVSASASALNMQEFFRGLAVFAEDNKAEDAFPMPSINDALPGYDFPDFLEPFGIVVDADFARSRPADYERLVETFERAMGSSSARSAARSAGMEGFFEYWSPEECREFNDDFESILNRYGNLLQQ